MKTISCFLRRHQAAKAWVFGKGPSLDGFDMDRPGEVRICINESALVVPRPAYFFAHDEGPIRRVAAKWPSGCAAILEPQRAAYAAKCGVPQSAVFTYRKAQGDEGILAMSAEEAAARGALYGKSGTVHSALHFCRLVGVKAVTLVGFDGEGDYARCLGLQPGGGRHALIRKDLLDMLSRLDLAYHLPGTPAVPGAASLSKEEAECPDTVQES